MRSARVGRYCGCLVVVPEVCRERRLRRGHLLQGHRGTVELPQHSAAQRSIGRQLARLHGVEQPAEDRRSLAYLGSYGHPDSLYRDVDEDSDAAVFPGCSEGRYRCTRVRETGQALMTTTRSYTSSRLHLGRTAEVEVSKELDLWLRA